MQTPALTTENIAAAAHRFGFSALILLVHELGLPTGTGRSGVAAAISERLNDTTSHRSITQLLSAYQEHILYGDKLLNLHDSIPPNYLRELRRQLHHHPIPAHHRLAEIWPNALPHTEMLSLLHEDPVLVHIETEPEYTHLVYATITAVNEQTEFIPEQLGATRPDFTNDYNRFIGVKFVPRQCFDVISIHDTGLIEIKIDYLKGENTRLNNKEKQDRIHLLKDNLNSIARPLMLEPIPWTPPLNFYPGIDYLIKNEINAILGKISQSDNQGCDINFARRKRNEDVRDSIVFSRGNAALAEAGDNPKAHDLLARFPLPRHQREHFPELIIHSGPDIHQHGQPSIHDAIITKNIGREDYLIIRRILQTAITP